MTFAYRCPGTTIPGIRGSRTSHGACCAQFALSSTERRARLGVRYRVPDPILAVEDDIDAITIGELVEVVRLLQLAADDQTTPPVSPIQYVLLDPGYPQDELDALLDLGAPYGLQVHWVRPADISSPPNPEGQPRSKEQS